MPLVTLNYTGFDAVNYNTLSPNITQIAIPLYATEITFSTNIAAGTWFSPVSISPGNRIGIQLFTLESPGEFSFTTKETWSGEETKIFVLDVSSTGLYFIIRFKG